MIANIQSCRSSFTRLCAPVLAALLATGCGNLKKARKTPPPPAPADPSAGATHGSYRPVGEIVFVNLSAGFVLIQTSRGLSLEPGDALFSGPLKAFTAQLTVSPERKKQFTAADIANGDPAINDTVYRFDKPADPPEAKAAKKTKGKSKAKAKPKPDPPAGKWRGWFRTKKKNPQEPAAALPKNAPIFPQTPPSGEAYAPAPRIPLP